MRKTKLFMGIAIISILFTACGEEEAPKAMEKKEEITKQKVVKQEVSKDINESLTEKKELVKEEIVTPTVEKVKEKIAEKKEVITPMVEKVQKIVSVPDAKTTFQKCSSCHGQNAEKKALNKSAIIKDWDAAKIAEALKGYQNGTYGGAMKALMKSQVSSLSDEDITALAKYISTLNN